MSGTININSGQLENTSRYALIASLRVARQSGVLSFFNGAVTKELLFSQGLLVGSTSDQVDDAIGTLLLNWGTITQETHRKLQVRTADLKGRKSGEHLMSMGVIDKPTLTQALREQVLWRVGELFRWRRGKYIFTPGEVRDRTEPLTHTEVFGAAVRYSLGNDYLKFAGTELLDTVPKDERNSPFEILVLEEPELASLLNRATGRVPFRGLLGTSEPTQFWSNVLVLRELHCISFALPPELEAFRESEGNQYMRPNDVPESADSISIYLQTSDRSFKRGRKFLREGNFDEAEKAFTMAVSLAPQAGTYLANLAWTRVQRKPKDPTVLTSALALLRRAVHAAPADTEVAYFHAGTLWLSGARTAAEAEFARVLTLDPNHAEAKGLMKQLYPSTTGIEPAS